MIIGGASALHTFSKVSRRKLRSRRRSSSTSHEQAFSKVNQLYLGMIDDLCSTTNVLLLKVHYYSCRKSQVLKPRTLNIAMVIMIDTMAIAILVYMRRIFECRCCVRNGFKGENVWTLEATLGR